MKFTNIFEKIGMIFDMIISSNLLIILVFLMIGAILLKLTNKINNKKLGIILYLIQLSGLVYMILTNTEYLSNLGNDIIDGIFMNFYFPSIYIYLVVFAFTFIIFMITLLNRYLANTYRVITNIYFYTFNFLFILFIYVICLNDINVFDKLSLFTCNSALILLELSMSLFFIYLVVTALIYITNYLIVKVSVKKIAKVNDTKEAVLPNNLLEATVPEVNINSEVNDKVEVIPDSNNEVAISFNDVVDNLNRNDNIDLVPEVSLNDIKPSYVMNDYKFIDPDLFNEKSSLYEDKELKERMNFIDLSLIEQPKEETLTLKDYKLFSNMLKTILENNGSNNLKVSEILDKALLTRYSLEEYSKFEKILNSCLN